MSTKPTNTRKKTLRTLLLLLPTVLFGAVVGWFGAGWIDALTGGNDALFFVYLLLLLVGLILAFIVQIIVHEGGHLLFGLMTGYRFVSFNILGIIWHKGPDGRLHMNRMQIAGAGGQCLMSPPDYNEGRFPFILYNLGGALTNLIAALLFGLLAWALPFAPVRILLGTQAAVGVVFALLNGLPIPVEAIQNDGTNLVCIRRDENARRAFWTQMKVAAELVAGRRLKHLPDEWFRPFPEEAMSNPIVTAIAVMNTSRLMDEMDFAAAEREIRALMAREKGVLPLYRMTMACDGAVCEMIAGRPADLTDMLDTPDMQQLIKAMPNYPSILRTQYAVALLKERDGEKAARLLERFNSAALHHPNPQEIVGERELLLAIQNALLNGGACA